MEFHGAFGEVQLVGNLLIGETAKDAIEDRVAGLDADARTERKFREWLASFVAEHMEREPEPKAKKVKA